MILPRILLIGCRPLVPYHGQADPLFHSPPVEPQEVGDFQWPAEKCPTCRGKIGLRKGHPLEVETPGSDGKVEYRTDDVDPQHPESIDHLTFCLWCYGTSLKNAARISRLLSYRRAKRLAEDADEQSARKIKEALASRIRVNAILTESERRRIYCGYKGGIGYLPGFKFDRHSIKFVYGSLSKIGRDWLIEIDQLPDFTVIIDGSGKKVGFWQEEEDGGWVAVYHAVCNQDEPPHKRFLNFPPGKESA